MNKNKYVVLNGAFNGKENEELTEIAYTSSLKKAKEIAKVLVDRDSHFLQNHEFKGLFNKREDHIFVTAIKLNRDDVTEYIYNKEVK